MKRDRLESFVDENRHEFDHLEPSDNVWETISLKLEQKEQRPKSTFLFLKIAAMIILAISVPATIYFQVENPVQSAKSNATVDPDVQELIEAEAYYSEEVSGKLAEIQKCYKVHPELKAQIEGDLNELETMYLSLKKDLKDNVSNKEVIEAMIENNRNRMKLVDEVLEQINC
jgi:uncharacterized protein involved in exopolysaccharide biosynthesis